MKTGVINFLRDGGKGRRGYIKVIDVDSDGH